MSDIKDFVIENGVLKKYKGKEIEIVIPEGVTSIGDSAFEYCSSLTSINIPDSVTSIGDFAFSWCNKLKTIAIPDSVTSIGWHAFSYCKNLTIHAPKGSYAEQYAKENKINFVAE